MLIITGNLFSQIIITDNINQPIPFVQLISNNKHFFAQSNLKGAVDEGDFKKLNTEDTLFFHHVSYERSFRKKADLSAGDTIRLQQKAYELREFAVSSIKSNKKYKNISACYRGYQANNDSIAYYTDGKIEYVTKAKKHNYKNLRKEYRSFANTRLEEDSPHRSIGITYLATGVPYPPSDYLPTQYADKHNLIYLSQDNGKIAIMNRDSVLIGEIEKSPDYIKYSINDKSSIGTRKMFNTEINTLNIEVIMLFRNNRIADEKSIENFDDLLYFKNLSEVKVRHDKDKEYTEIMSVNELFIEDVWFTDSIGDEEYHNGFGMPNKSSYNSEFWKTCNCEAYYPPNEKILRGLYER